MVKKPATQPSEPESERQSPFDRFQAALALVVSVPKSSLPTQKKKARKK